MADEAAPTQKRLNLQKIYLKDVSFESPQAPDVFFSNDTAETLLNVRADNYQIDADTIEVTLGLNVKIVIQETTVFSIELVQGGVFSLQGFSADERHQLVGNICPSMLYAFARQNVSNIVDKSGFAGMQLQLLDFDAMYAQNLRERSMENSKTS